MSAAAVVAIEKPPASASRPLYRPAAFSMMIRSIAERCRLLALAARIPIDPARPYVVTISQWSAATTDGQRRCSWSLIHRTAQRTGDAPFALHCEVIKLYLPERAHMLLDPTADITKDLDSASYAALIDGAASHLEAR